MKEYIERAALIDDFEHCGASKEIVDAIVYRINLHNAADVAEVRHGRWERVSTASGIISRVRCSVCAGTQPLTFENMPYCPTCGARMDEEDGHEIS
jgi:hypothetical protein